jgi:secreted Zn-dependent insulinase-like peptidase
MKHYDKTGRISAPQDSSQLNSIPKKPSFVYQDFLNLVAAKGQEFPDHVMEGDGKKMVYLPDEPFKNWGLTVKNKPSYTFTARTRVGVQNLVKWASHPSRNKRVRVAGFRHTWG